MLLSLLIFVFVATMSPGGATALAMASGMQFGVGRSLALIMGLAFGLAILAGAAALGLSTVILASPKISLVLKLAGSGYLLWLAWLIANAPTNQNTDAGQAPLTMTKGLLLMWLNPKAWAMTLSASASFVFTELSILWNGVIFCGVFLVAASISLLLWSFVGKTTSKLIKSPRQWRMVNITMGVLIAATVATLWT